ncbi:nucleotide sugar dehydrogenase [Sporosarcina sp. A2]|uniref:nucleotide sugar dehydrogenase n=1 Tax=Sporosarcina sp. A2 TaxID=3393449 RepID=UPI003D7913D1
MKKSICVVGLGYIGLPTSVMFANHGHQVHGVDVNEKAVEGIRNKKLHIEESGLQERLNDAIDSGMMTVSTTPEKADVYILAVPSPIKMDKTADMKYIESASESIVPYLEKGNLVILESTVPPRTVQDVVIPKLKAAGLEIGTELYVSHSPERVIPGRVFEELISNDRIIGGVNEQSAQMTSDLYRSFVKGQMHETDDTTAELVKVMENTYRDVNIALANELAKISGEIGVDVWEAIRLANFHPRVNIHQPGPGVGGHCIAVDPWFLVELKPDLAKIIHLARQTNDGMPAFTAKTTKDILQQTAAKNTKVAVLGLAFKGNIDDMRESPSVDVVNEMKEYDLSVTAYDPHIHENNIKEQVQSIDDAMTDASVIVILTNHDEFKKLDPRKVADKVSSRVIFDTKKCIDRLKWEEAGFDVHILGDAKNQ